MRGAKIIKKGARKQVPTPQLHGSEIVRIIALYNLSRSLSEDLVGLVRSLLPSDNALKKVRLGKQKTTNIIHPPTALFRCYHRTSLASLFPKLQIKTPKNNFELSPFSSMSQSFKHSTFMWIWWERKMEIYSKLKDTFSELDIQMEYIIGYSSDTTNAMFGQHNSGSKLFKSKDEQVKIVKCFCDLVSSEATLKLTKDVEDLCTDIYCHRSSKRQKVYSKFQTFFYAELSSLKLSSPAHIQWLSLQACDNRIY